MKVSYELSQGMVEFELTERQICEFIADDLFDMSEAYKFTSRKEFVARMTETLYRNADGEILAKAFDLENLNDAIAEYFADEFLDKDELREWNAKLGYDSDDKGD